MQTRAALEMMYLMMKNRLEPDLLADYSDCNCRAKEPYAVHVDGMCMTCGKAVGLTDEQLIYQFHAAGMWTPEEIEETMLVYARSTYMAPLMNVPPEQLEYIINGVMLDRFQQERRGMWGRVVA